MRGLLLILSLLLTYLPATAQVPTNATVNVRTELTRNEIVLGDQIYLTINISAPPGTEVAALAPEQLNGLPGVEVIEAEELKVIAENPERLLEQRLLITSFDTGYVSIPPLPITFTDAMGLADTVYTDDLLLTVNGAVVSAEEDILPIKPILEEPRNLLDYWWVVALLGVGVLIFGVREYRRRQTKLPPAAPPPPPAHVRALTELDELEQRNLWQNGQTDTYYVVLTRILRTYLEARFAIPALEMTTRQITRELKERAGLDAEERKELGELLQLSDLVKFAKATPPEDLHPRSLQRVRDFVRATGIEERTEPQPVADNNA